MAFVDLCRLCGTDTLNIVRNAIFEGEGRVKKYALKISECLTLKVAEEDQLPKIMCGECSYKLDLLSDFRDVAYKTETQLLSKIDVNKVKAELPDVIDSPDLDNEDFGGDDNSCSSSPEPLPEPLVEIKEEENLPKKRSPTKRSWRVLESEGEETPVKKRGRPPKQPPATTSKAAAATPAAASTTPVAAPPKENSGPLVELVDNCEVCCKPLQSAAELRLHLRTCINPKHRLQRENALKCPTCKSQFKDANGLAVHMKVHNPPPTPALGKRNESPKSSAEKSAKKQAEKKYSCDSPGCSFFTNLLTHLQLHNKRLHSPSYTYSCHLCGNVFKEYRHLQEHVLRHQVATGGFLRCIQQGCNLTLPEDDFESHVGQHSKNLGLEPTYECEHCGLTQKSKALLKSHTNRHFMKLPWHLNCLYGRCRKIFSLSADLRKHVARHAKSAPKFTCSKCNKCFPSRGSLRLHIKSHLKTTPRKEVAVVQKQSAVSAFSCLSCDAKFSTLPQLTSHAKEHVVEVFPCLRHNCQQSFSSKKELVEHLKQHSEEHKFKCDSCDKTYPLKSSLTRHILQNHLEGRGSSPPHVDVRGPFRCSVAGCTFAGRLKLHLQGHTKRVHNNPGSNCRFCGKFFKQMRYLKPHLLLHETADSPSTYRCTHKGCDHVTTLTELKKHVLEHKVAVSAAVVVKTEPPPPDGFFCKFPGCAKQFQSLKSLCIHKSIAHRTQP